MSPVKNLRPFLGNLNRPQRLLIWLTTSVLLLAWAFPQVNIGYYSWQNPPISLLDDIINSAPPTGSIPNNQAHGSPELSQHTDRDMGAWRAEPFYVVHGRRPSSDLGRFSDASSDEALLRHYTKYQIRILCSSGCEGRIAIDWSFQILCSLLAATICFGGLWALKSSKRASVGP